MGIREIKEMKRDSFSKVYAILVTIYGCGYLAAYTWAPIPLGNSGDAKLILGFIMGTMLGTAISWSIGTSKSSSDKTQLLVDKGNENPEINKPEGNEL